MVLKYIRLFRLKTTLIYLFPFALALSVGVEEVANGIARPVSHSWITVLWVTVLFGYLAYFCGSFFSSTLNCYVDVPADRVHDGLYKDQELSRQPFVTGEMSTRETVLTFAITGAGCVVFSLLVNWRFAVFMLSAVLLLGILYSHPWFRFKEKPVLDVLTNATGAVLILYAGMAVVSADNPPFIPIIFGWFFSATLYIPSVANDAPFDEAAGYRTSGVVFGQRRLIHAMVPLTMIVVGIGIWGALSGSINWQYRLFCVLGAPAAIVATAAVMFTFHPPHIELNPLLLLVPLSCLLLFYIILSTYRVITV
ncbi:MAG: UbiA family prenyltransferase [Actinobacteria bacterium]|nr:UbiA family prenyltransferase [Actinomycetota bacterium]MBU4392406.1 UbiA family prenyltransferase [Actinomycetota bacterium]MBU4403025.1 UbiA family prenyltransferase [Actinomycetota bacterium]MBU4442705.1 UbiA family prenyltransferase [Actinomycetota bacterium]